MKKPIIVGSLTTLLLFLACNKKEIQPNQNPVVNTTNNGYKSWFESQSNDANQEL